MLEGHEFNKNLLDGHLTKVPPRVENKRLRLSLTKLIGLGAPWLPTNILEQVSEWTCRMSTKWSNFALYTPTGSCILVSLVNLPIGIISWCMYAHMCRMLFGSLMLTLLSLRYETKLNLLPSLRYETKLYDTYRLSRSFTVICTKYISYDIHIQSI